MATAETQTVEERLRVLYSLQEIDSKVDEIKILKGELPIEVSDLEDEIAGLETRVSKLEASISDIESEIANHNNNIHESITLIERYEKQLDNVKNNREYDALTKELELQKLEIQLSKKKISEAEVAKESKVALKSETDEKLNSRKANLETKKDELEKIIEKTEKEEVKLGKQAEKVRKQIEPRLLKSYDRIRQNYRNGLAVVSVNRGACGGCFNRIPPQTIIEIGVMKKIIACEHCGRVLVGDSIAGDEE
jgi:predicted  nucleic acid-binding Zn-ribbon protein